MRVVKYDRNICNFSIFTKKNYNRFCFKCILSIEEKYKPTKFCAYILLNDYIKRIEY